ncbi:selenide, water dikinase [Deltaproteobacteria bacterium]|nr:selenide, water dikinase [Deltaproteobacteria bacterium]
MNLLEKTRAAGCAAKLASEDLERLLNGLAGEGRPDLESRVLSGRAYHEDAVAVAAPQGKALVQTVDFLTPIVNNAFAFGRIAAANALSDVYAMGGEPWCAINVACFPLALAKDDPDILVSILRGGLDALNEAGAVLAGGHTVQDEELKYGLAVTGVIDPEHMAVNSGLQAGHLLVLTKPLGVGILATAIKTGFDGAEESEAELVRWCGRLNNVAGALIRNLKLPAATDVTGFGLGGHILEMAFASGVCVEIDTAALPLLPRVLRYARDGLIPAGSHVNRKYRRRAVLAVNDIDDALESVIFDAQTSGGLLLALPPRLLDRGRDFLLAGGDLACVVGKVLPPRNDGKALLLR